MTTKKPTKADLEQTMEILKNLNEDLQRRVDAYSNEVQIWARDVETVKKERDDIQDKLDSAQATKVVTYGVGVVGIVAMIASLFI